MCAKNVEVGKMKKARIFYGILWALATIAYFTPWAKVNGEVYTGWQFTVPFSFTYLIGIILGIIVLTTKWRKTAMTIVAGILMILGVLGGAFGYAIGAAVAGLVGKTATTEVGSGLALLLSIIYTVAGTIIARRM